MSERPTPWNGLTQTLQKLSLRLPTHDDIEEEAQLYFRRGVPGRLGGTLRRRHGLRPQGSRPLPTTPADAAPARPDLRPRASTKSRPRSRPTRRSFRSPATRATTPTAPPRARRSISSSIARRGFRSKSGRTRTHPATDSLPRLDGKLSLVPRSLSLVPGPWEAVRDTSTDTSAAGPRPIAACSPSPGGVDPFDPPALVRRPASVRRADRAARGSRRPRSGCPLRSRSGSHPAGGTARRRARRGDLPASAPRAATGAPLTASAHSRSPKRRSGAEDGSVARRAKTPSTPGSGAAPAPGFPASTRSIGPIR